jgi:hypothetical protein
MMNSSGNVVVVVDAALLGVDRRHRILRRAAPGGVHQRVLRRHDGHPHVAGHQRADQDAGLDERAAPTEHLREAVDGAEQHRDREHGRDHRIPLAIARPQAVVDDPADQQRARRQRDPDQRRQLGDARIDQERRTVHVIDDDHQGDAGHPRRQVLVLEPVQRLGQRAGLEQLLLDVVERAGVDHVDLALRELAQVGGLLEVAIEPVEQHRVADPHDPGDQVNPPKREVQELVATHS